jgi:sugar phosphate isomerase/epimerase
MARLSLESLTLTDTQPADIVRAASEAGFDIVSLWVQPPPLYPAPLLTAEKEAACAAALADSDLEVIALEAFDLQSIAEVEGWRDALERGARLGGKVALAINFTNPDPVETAEALARLAEVAGEYGLGVNLEPVAGGQTSTLAQGLAMIAASRADAGIVFDPWHLIASGGGVADLDALDLSRIRYVQLCDGPVPLRADRVVTDAVCERLYPGYGAFPLLEMLRRLPRDVPVGIECPSLRRAAAGMSPLEQAREALAAARGLLARLDGEV